MSYNEGKKADFSSIRRPAPLATPEFVPRFVNRQYEQTAGTFAFFNITLVGPPTRRGANEPSNAAIPL